MDPKLLSVLVCPKSRGPLTYDKAANELISKKAKLAFPIREGVPIMLIDEARSLEA
ncbi:MAG: Trm112 family protein [Maricaulaceae bacterium]